MCGRYTIVSKLKVIEKEFRVDISEVLDRFEINPNVSPGQEALVIASDQPDKAQLFTFGLTPHWAKKKMYVINARTEGDHNKENDPRYTGARGIISKPMFRKPIRNQRCLVLADAFIEGTEKEKLSKPFLVYKKGKKRPFAMAGIWDEWIDQETGEILKSFAILTTAATPLMQKIPHHRSPLVLSEEDEKRWINDELSLDQITPMMAPFDDDEFNAYPISPDIKKPGNRDVEVLKPTGKPLREEYEYIFYKELELQGMGETTARKRKQNEQLDLFD